MWYENPSLYLKKLIFIQVDRLILTLIFVDNKNNDIDVNQSRVIKKKKNRIVVKVPFGTSWRHQYL